MSGDVVVVEYLQLIWEDEMKKKQFIRSVLLIIFLLRYSFSRKITKHEHRASFQRTIQFPLKKEKKI